MTPLSRADLHVHTCYSKVCGTLTFLGSRDSYSRPEDVYRTAKARGMDFVAITDHDSIDGALELLSTHPDLTDVIVGEEVSCRLPDGDIEVHLGVYGMTERLHRELQPLRRNAFEVATYLRDAVTASLPGQFVIPVAVAAMGKARERREVRRATTFMDAIRVAGRYDAWWSASPP